MVNVNINAETVGLEARFIEIAATVVKEFIADMFSMSFAVVNYHFARQCIEIILLHREAYLLI